MTNIVITNVTVCGAGVLGSQIAFQTAFHNFNVVVYDIDQVQLEKTKAKFIALGKSYIQDLKASQHDVDTAISRITFSIDLKEATKNADLVIEAIPENIKTKKRFYQQLGEVAPAKSIFCTNSSTLLPSMFAKETGRPERFLALHFANNIWKNNTAEIMGHADTAPHIFETIVTFAKAIGMVALPIYKEQPGYILNTLLVPFIKSALALYINDISDPMTIDKTWMKATGAPMGPFGICDIIGINTIFSINKMGLKNQDPHAKKVVEVLQEHFIDKGKFGVPSGEGFYSYPNPKYEDANFLK